MNYKNILKAAAAAVASLSLFAGCTQAEFKEVTELNLARCLEPQNLGARVDVATGDNVTFEWDVNKDAQQYNLVVYTDEAMTAEALNTTLEASEVPYTTRLTADKEYFFKVQALAQGRGASNWAVYDGSFKTYAVKDNLFLEITGRTSGSVSLKWSAEASDYKEVTHITARPVAGGDAVKLDLSDAQAAAAAATVSGLQPSTEYQLVLYYLSASRGAVDAWTIADGSAYTTISTSEELVAAAKAGGSYYLAYSGSPYTLGAVVPATSLTLVGELSADGDRPVVDGAFALDSFNDASQSLYFEGITFTGLGNRSRVIDQTPGTTPTLGSIKFVNCRITDYKCGLFYDGNNDAVATIGEFSFNTCDIDNILGSGGDVFDVRKSINLGTLKFVNNTIYDGMRTFFRIDASENTKIDNFIFDNNTVKGICVMDDGNNRGIFSMRVAMTMSLKNNLFLWEDGGKKDEGTVDRAQLFQDHASTVVPTLTAENNYCYAQGKDFFNLVDAASAGFKVLAADPCYNSKGNFFQLSAQDLIAGKVGASKWWISFVEKEEDLTQNVVEGAHTWNFKDATLFAGDVKNSRVRDELLLVGTEATPLNADGAIKFLGAAVLNRKGVPTEGYASFKVNTPGSVDIEVVDGGAGSVVVALQDDNGFAVLGGVMAGANNGVQKVLVPAVAGEGTVYLYPTGAITVKQLAWSLDAEGGNCILDTPKPAVEPVTLTEGDETEVTVSWEAVKNAASYVVVFNKKSMAPQAELSFTVPAEDIAGLKAGLYTFTVQALPADGDIYYTKSDKGAASFAIQPKSSGGEVVEVTWTWDFSASDWQEQFATLGGANSDITNWNLTYDNLTIVSTAKSKYNTTFFQWGGKGSTSDRYMKFTAPEQGTLKVWASNTGSSEATDRFVTVNQDGEETSVVGGVPSSGEPALCEFSVKAGEVLIYCTGNALRFYKVEFSYSYTTGGSTPVEYDWDFSASDWQEQFATLGGANSDITNWNLTYDNLTIVSTAKSKYNTTFFQWGGKGSTSDRYMKFTAPEQGTLKVWASNTGSSEATDRFVTVNQDGEETSVVGGVPSSGEPALCEFSVKAGEVLIYCTGNALRFYRVYYTNQ